MKSKVEQAAQNLFDNRLGWSDGRSPYAPTVYWYELGCALYGKDDSRVQNLEPEIHEKALAQRDRATQDEAPK